MVFIGTCTVTTALVSSFTKSEKARQGRHGLTSPSGPSIRVLDRVRVRIEMEMSVAHRSNLKLTLLQVYRGVYSNTTQGRADAGDAAHAGEAAGGGDGGGGGGGGGAGKRASESGGEKGAKKEFKAGKGPKGS